MSDFWTLENLAKTCDGKLLERTPHVSKGTGACSNSESLCAPKFARGVLSSSGITQDTRSIKQGMAYLSIKGERLDGHAFVNQAFDAGASCAIVEHDIADAKGPLIVVKSTLAAIQMLARAWRDELEKSGCKVIAICGSNGKTTTRHLLYQVLASAGLQGSQSPKSFNNHLGLPLTLLAAKTTDQFVCAEIGTNHPGEIANLAQIARPDIALLTSIGEEHLEFFKDLTGVAKEEASVFSYMKSSGLAVISAQAAKYTAPFERMTIGLERIIVSGEESHLPKDLPMPGAHGKSNAALVFAVAKRFDLTDEQIAKGLMQSQAAEGRWQKIQLGQGVVLIHDAYNANPSSVNAGLDELEKPPERTPRVSKGTGDASTENAHVPLLTRGVPSEAPSQTVMVVLGDMFELGEAAPAAHRAIAERIANARNLRPAIFIGAQYATQTAHLAGIAGIHIHPSFSDDLPEKIAALAVPNQTIWIKGSRGMRLERLIPALTKRFNS